MIDRQQLARQYLALQAQGRIEDALAMLAENVVSSSPITGTKTGRVAVEAEMRSQPPGVLMMVVGEYGGTDSISASQVVWAEPEDDGKIVKIAGKAPVFGSLKIALTFDKEAKIDSLDVRLGS